MATILEGLNKLSGALGGAETATENLEALNAIAGALGGETNATSNADAIDQIAEHASGGGGSSVVVEQLNVTENDTYTAPTGKAYSPVVVNVPAAGVTASVTFVADEGITLFGVTSMAYLVDDNQTYTAEDRTQFTASVPTTVPILDSIVLYELVCLQDQSTPLSNVEFDLAGNAEFNQDHEIVITGDCVITVKNAQ